MPLTAPDAQDDVIYCPITSRDRWPNARPLLAADLMDAALPLASWVRTARVVTLNSGLVIHRIGRVSEASRWQWQAKYAALSGKPRGRPKADSP